MKSMRRLPDAELEVMQALWRCTPPASRMDVAAALTGGTGVLPGELTSDGVHFTRSGYVQWLDYLKTHTVDAAAYQAGQAATQQLDEKGTDEI